MIKTVLFLMASLFAAAAMASTDVNKASQADLEAVKGIGPAVATKILDERKKGAFKDWGDLIDRVGGVGEGNAGKFSTAGLTVNGASFSAAPAKSPDKKMASAKPVAKKDDKK